jgi:hypothetical protein
MSIYPGIQKSGSSKERGRNFQSPGNLPHKGAFWQPHERAGMVDPSDLL